MRKDEEEYRKEAIDAGIELVSHLYKDNGHLSNKKLYRLQCGCLKEIRPDHVRHGRFVCTNCRLSREEYLKKYREDNKEHLSELNKRWRRENSEKLKEYYRLRYLENKEYNREKGKEHYQNNKAEYLYYSRTRKASQKQRTPPWLSKEQKKKILAFYREAKRLYEETGVKYHVDHIVPLQGEFVSGLHVPWNLQLLTEYENISKNNSFNYD